MDGRLLLLPQRETSALLAVEHRTHAQTYNIVIRERPAIFQLLAGKNKALLVRGDSLLVLNFALDILNRVAGLNFDGDGFS